jgi:hypothetical protein
MFLPRPQVINTLPQNYSTNVDVESIINIFFNTDIDRSHITDSVFVTDVNMNKINVQIAYNNRVITISPEPRFAPGMKYVITLIGGTDADGRPLGIRSILGEPLETDYQFTFTTTANAALDAPRGIFPENQVAIQTQPYFQWEPVSGAAGYQLKVSTSNTLTPVVWPENSDTYMVNSAGPIYPDYEFPDGTYYWAVRAVDQNGKPGNWSPLYVFNKDSRTLGTQASGDTLPPDAIPFYEEQAPVPVEIVESFPPNGGTNIGVNLMNMYIRVSGHFTQDQINKDMFTMIGKNVDGIHNNPDFPEHGVVNITDAIAMPQDDGTTIIKLVLGIVPSQAYIPQLP